MSEKDPNQGEGDRAGARRYDGHVREFVAEGKVESAAGDARAYVERDPEGAAKAEVKAKRGPGAGGLMGSVKSAVARLRARFGRK